MARSAPGIGWIADYTHGVEPFDLIVSNILAEVHLQSLEMGLLDSLRSGGFLLFSGMYRSGAAKVIDALHKIDCELVEESRMGRWWVLVSEKKMAG